MKTLAIEREFGSGGREIGMKVAEKAGIPYYDGNLLVEAAERYGISIGKLLDYDEKNSGSLLYNLATAVNYIQGIDTSDAIQIQYGVKETIKNLQQEGPAVFIGRCATEILKYHSDVVRVYIYSSNMRGKIARISKTENISEEEAKKLMDKKDHNRKNYFRFYTEKDWKDRNNYDIELNTGMISADDCSDILLYMMNK